MNSSPRDELAAFGANASPLYESQLNVDMKKDLLSNLYEYSDKVCSDPRDRVYALLSISLYGYDIAVNYTRHFEEVHAGISARMA